jgi:predicted TIM-barrel fold metal-dependent hydrolase
LLFHCTVPGEAKPNHTEEVVMEYRTVSADDHIDLQWLPKDLWQKRVPPQWRERSPRVADTSDGPYWFCGSDRWDPWGGRKGAAGAMGGRRLALERGGVLEPGVLRPTTTELRLADMDRDGVDATVMYGPIVPLLIQDPELRKVCYRAYNDWLAEFCRTDPARLKGIAMINLDDVQEGIKELERAARLGLAGAMITEYPLEHRRYDQSEYEPFWAAAAALDLPLSLHTATRRQGKIRGAGEVTLRDASSRATKAFYPALSMCDLIFSGVFERHPRLTLAIVEFELAWVPHVLSTMDYTYRERHGEAIYRFKDGMIPSDFFHRNVVLSFQEDAVGVRLRDVIGVDNMMWGSDYPHSESTFPQSRKILAEILAGVPDDEQAKIAAGNTARMYNFDVARLTGRP